MKHIPALDGLRAVAVLAVIGYHAGLIPAGFVGVDVFFVISGYLITRLLIEECAETGRIDFVAFYARRARRILPALAVVILATLGLSVLLLPDASGVAKSAAAASAFVANLWFQAQTSDYWAGNSAQMPLLHLWSLSVEEQFYLAWPLVMILARRKPITALSVLAVVSLAYAEWALARSPSVAFYAMPARAWELAVGGLVAMTGLRLRSTHWGLALVLLSCVVPFQHFPGLGALPAVIGAVLVIAGTDRVRVLEARPVVYVGLISYSLYLWHWPLLALDRALRVGETPLAVRLGLVTVAFVLAAASYRYVESPARRMRGRRRVVAAGVAAMAVLSCSAFAFVRPAPPPTLYSCTPGTVMLPSCVARAHKVVVWGDSFAQSWEPLALAIAGDRPVVTWHRDYCPPFAGITVPRRSKADTEECRANNDAALAYLQRNGADVLVLAVRFPTYTEAQLREGLGNLVRAWHGRIVVVGPTPEVLDDGPKCLAAGKDCAISREQYAEQSAVAWRVLRSLPVEVIDAGSWLCDRDACRAVRQGKPLYRDNCHVTTETAQAFVRISPTRHSQSE